MKSVFLTFSLICLSANFSSFSAGAVELLSGSGTAETEISSKDLAAGDNAFAAKDYPVAVSFYTKYLEETRKTGNVNAERIVHERLLDALILSKLTAQAEKSLNIYEQKFCNSEKNNITADLWRGEILIQKGQYRDAEKLYEKLLSRLPAQDPRRFRVLYSYGTVLEKQKMFQKAYVVFRTSWELTRNLESGRAAFEQMILCLAASGKINEALDELLKNPPSGTKADDDVYALLSAYLLLKGQGIEASSGVWKNLLHFLKEQSDPLQYLVASSFADAFMQVQDYRNALAAYRAAFHSASDRTEVHDTLNRMISVITAAGNTADAAKLAMSQLELLKHSYLKPELKFRTAALLRDSGNSKGAMELYESVFANINSSPKDQKQALYEYALILSSLNRFSDAEKTIRLHFQNRNVADGEFLLAEVEVRSGKKDLFPQQYRMIADRWPQYAEKALMLGARASIEAGLPDEALSMTQKVRVLSAGKKLDNSLLYIEAASYAAKENFDKALQMYDEYLAVADKKDPLYPQALYHSGTIAFVSGKYPLAVRRFIQLKKDFPNHPLLPEASAWLIQVYFVLNDNAASERETLLLAKNYPKSEYAADALFRLASRYAAEGAAAKAVSALQKLAKDTRFPLIQARAQYELALQAGNQGNTAVAIMHLQKLYEDFPETPTVADGYYLNGDLLRKQSDFKSAINFYRKVLEIRPDSTLAAAAYGSIGDCLLSIASPDPTNSKNELNASLQAYRSMQAIQACPPAFKAMGTFRIGRCFELLGDKKAAGEEYLKLLYRYPADQVKSYPIEMTWCIRAAEALVDLANKNPLRSTLLHARTALHWLSDTRMITPVYASERFEKLKDNKFNP